LGLTSALVYWFGLVQLTPLLANLNIPLQDLGKITGYRWEAAGQFGGSLVALYGMYILGYRWCGLATGKLEPIVVAVCALGFCCLLIFAYPSTAADVFDYIMQLRVLWKYGANPHSTAPSFFDQDPFLPYIAWTGFSSPYAPLWTWIATPASLLGGEDLLGSVLAFKGFAVLLYAICAALIWAILAGHSPIRRLRGLYIFAWNPLVLWEVAGNAHNDVTMLAFTLLGILAIQRRRDDLALLGLVAAGLVKFTNGLLAPLALARSLREPQVRWPMVAAGLGYSLVLSLVIIYPFWEGLETLKGLVAQGRKMTTSLASLISIVWQTTTGDTPPLDNVAIVVVGLFTVLYLREVLRPDLAQQDFADSAFRVMFYFIAIAVVWFQPWYLISLLVLAAVSSSQFYARLAMLYSMTGMFAYLLFIYFWVNNWNNIGVPEIQATGALAIHGLPVGWYVCHWWRERSSNARALRR
jgi:hypothetical protein